MFRWHEKEFSKNVCDHNYGDASSHWVKYPIEKNYRYSTIDEFKIIGSSNPHQTKRHGLFIDKRLDALDISVPLKLLISILHCYMSF